MDMKEVGPGVTAFLRHAEGANVGLISTADGPVLVDTTSSPADMQELLDAASLPASEVCLVINTHFHTDHTWGNQLFDCPIVAHRLCREWMEAKLVEDWTVEAIEASLAQVEIQDPDSARMTRQKLTDLRITLPTQVFDDEWELEVGGVRIDLVHVGGHTSGATVVHLPAAAVLFAGDLVFEGRYPYLADADLSALISELKRLPELGARVIVPGHGSLCGEQEVLALVEYLEAATACIADHLAHGHSLEQAMADPGYPRYVCPGVEGRREDNVRAVYTKLASPPR